MSERSTVVLDASALLCLILCEPGAERVEAVMNRAAMSTVNYAEVISKLIDRGVNIADIDTDLAELDIDLVPLDRSIADVAARLRSETRSVGLSLGDRCCLALAKQRGARAVTTDRAWSTISAAIGVDVDTVR